MCFRLCLVTAILTVLVVAAGPSAVAASAPAPQTQTESTLPYPLVREAPYVIPETLDLDGGFDFHLGNFGEATRYFPIIDGLPYDLGEPHNNGWWINAETTKVPVARAIVTDARTHHYVYQGSTATLSLENAQAQVDFLWHQRAEFDNSIRILTGAPQDQGKGLRDTYYYLFDQPPYWSASDAPPWRARFVVTKPQSGPYPLPNAAPVTVPIIDPSERFIYANEGRSFQFIPTVYGSASGDGDTNNAPPYGVMELDLRLQVDHHYRKIQRPVIFLDFAIAAEGRVGKMGLFGQPLASETGAPSSLQATNSFTRTQLVKGVQSIFDQAKVPVLVTTDQTEASRAFKVVTVRFGDTVTIPCSSLASFMGYCDPDSPGRHYGVAEESDVSKAGPDQFDQDPIQSVRVFAQIASNSRTDDLRMVAGTVAHEVAHTFGAMHLELEPSDPDYMTSIMSVRDPSPEQIKSIPANCLEPKAKIDLCNQAFSQKPGALVLVEVPVQPRVTHNPVYHMRRWAAGEDAEYLEWDGLDAGSWEQIAFEDLTKEHSVIMEIYMAIELREAVQGLYDVTIDSLLNYGDDVGVLSELTGPLGPGTHTVSFLRQGRTGIAIVGGDPDADFLDVGFVSDLGDPEGSFRHLVSVGDAFSGHVVRARDDGSLATIGEFSLSVSAVPEPSIAAMLAVGLTLISLLKRGSTQKIASVARTRAVQPPRGFIG